MAISRRSFVAAQVTCATHLALAASAMPLAARKLWAAEPLGTVVAREPFGTLEQVADGVWAHISTPLTGTRTTVANGGLIAGRNGVLAIEGFNQPEGAIWLAGKSKELTGTWPTHIAVTHYHGDHANGVAGYHNEADHPHIRSTERTRELILGRNQAAESPDSARAAALNDAVLLSASETEMLDLGGRSVRFVPRGGHTDSDVTIELDDPNVVFCGDLVWNAMFPNYVDTVPSKMAASVHALKRSSDTIYVPGHGALAGPGDLERYIAMLDEVERAARGAHAAGITVEDAGNAFTLPQSVGDWALFNPSSKVFYHRAFQAWYGELKG
jgi:glyoxylase-like metal-dependent hydrolase (beta-lactamase superfamily II)